MPSIGDCYKQGCGHTRRFIATSLPLIEAFYENIPYLNFTKMHKTMASGLIPASSNVSKRSLRQCVLHEAYQKVIIFKNVNG